MNSHGVWTAPWKDGLALNLSAIGAGFDLRSVAVISVARCRSYEMEVRIEHATDRPTLGTQTSLETTVVLICLVGNNEDAEEELKKYSNFFA